MPMQSVVFVVRTAPDDCGSKTVRTFAITGTRSTARHCVRTLAVDRRLPARHDQARHDEARHSQDSHEAPSLRLAFDPCG